jgi:hypothetical protein
MPAEIGIALERRRRAAEIVGFIIDGIGASPETPRIRSSRAMLFPNFRGSFSRKPICPSVFDQRVEIPIR